MLHLFPHTCSVVRKTVIGTEDGTPVYGEEVIWSGSCRLDSPRDSSTKVDGTAGVATKVKRVAPLFLDPAAIVAKDDFVEVTTDLESGRWTVDTVEAADGLTSAHHLEVRVHQEKNR